MHNFEIINLLDINFWQKFTHPLSVALSPSFSCAKHSTHAPSIISAASAFHTVIRNNIRLNVYRVYVEMCSVVCILFMLCFAVQTSPPALPPPLHFNNCDQIMDKYLIRHTQHITAQIHIHQMRTLKNGTRAIEVSTLCAHKQTQTQPKSTLTHTHTHYTIFTNWRCVIIIIIIIIIVIIIYNCNAWKLNHQVCILYVHTCVRACLRAYMRPVYLWTKFLHRPSPFLMKIACSMQIDPFCMDI